MNLARIICAAALAVMLAGGTSRAADPALGQPLSPEQLNTLKISGISTDADEGVLVAEGDSNLICAKVTNYIEANHPGMLTDAADTHTLKMRIHFTHFEHGNALKRWLLPGTGRTYIAAMVYLEDTTGKQVASYDVSAHFSRSGVPGATTRTSDVEETFAKSVGRTVTDKP
jgi:Domain of unknown function (DUF4410)